MALGHVLPKIRFSELVTAWVQGSFTVARLAVFVFVFVVIVGVVIRSPDGVRVVFGVVIVPRDLRKEEVKKLTAFSVFVLPSC